MTAVSAGVMVNGRHYAFLAYSSSQLKVRTAPHAGEKCCRSDRRHFLVPHCGSAESAQPLVASLPSTPPPLKRSQLSLLLLPASPLCRTQAWSCCMVADPRQGQPGAAGGAAIAHALRHWMGDALDTIRIPAKCAARLGQCFSTTVDAARVEGRQLVNLPDVECNGYCFSDGVGCISPGEATAQGSARSNYVLQAGWVTLHSSWPLTLCSLHTSMRFDSLPAAWSPCLLCRSAGRGA